MYDIIWTNPISNFNMYSWKYERDDKLTWNLSAINPIYIPRTQNVHAEQAVSYNASVVWNSSEDDAAWVSIWKFPSQFNVAFIIFSTADNCFRLLVLISTVHLKMYWCLLFDDKIKMARKPGKKQKENPVGCTEERKIWKENK